MAIEIAVTKYDNVHHVRTNRGSHRFLYHGIVARNYWSATGMRQDALMLDVNCKHCDEDKKCFWFTALRCFLTIIVYDASFKKASAAKRTINIAFFENLYRVGSLDSLHLGTSCIKLRWARGKRQLDSWFQRNESPLDPENGLVSRPSNPFLERYLLYLLRGRNNSWVVE